jgi:hypothetical protein
VRAFRIPLPADRNSGYRSKGLTELGLAALGYTETIIVRPAFLNGKPNASIGQRLFGSVSAFSFRALLTVSRCPGRS